MIKSLHECVCPGGSIFQLACYQLLVHCNLLHLMDLMVTVIVYFYVCSAMLWTFFMWHKTYVLEKCILSIIFNHCS